MHQAKASTLLELRQARGLTIRQMGVDQAYYVGLEHGRRLPGPRALQGLAGALSLPCETVWAACQASCEIAKAHAPGDTEGGAQ